MKQADCMVEKPKQILTLMGTILLFGLVLVSAASAADVSSATDVFRAQIAGVAAAEKAYQSAGDPAKQEELWTAFTRTNDATITNVMQIARTIPADPASFEMLIWILTNNRSQVGTLRPFSDEAIELLREHHSTHPDLGPVCQALAWRWSASKPAIWEFLSAASTNNPSRNDRAYALFALAHLTKVRGGNMAGFEFGPPSVRTNARAKLAYEQDSKAGNSHVVLEQAIKMFEKIKSDYGQCPNFPSGPGLRAPKPTLGEQAEVERFDCEHLQIGQVPPDISGKDLDGKKFKLSDSKGKVVFLSFWASWCGPCMQMVPHECALAKRMAGRPFVMLGVNGDTDLDKARSVRTKEAMTWRSFQNGGDSESGIAADWNVHGWPTVFAMDAKGVIRFKFEGYGGKWTDNLLDELADQLVQEAEASKSRP